MMGGFFVCVVRLDSWILSYALLGRLLDGSTQLSFSFSS
nr:MAG TPA: hypothetical protein [Caudoviricetes sp.]